MKLSEIAGSGHLGFNTFHENLCTFREGSREISTLTVDKEVLFLDKLFQISGF